MPVYEVALTTMLCTSLQSLLNNWTFQPCLNSRLLKSHSCNHISLVLRKHWTSTASRWFIRHSTWDYDSARGCRIDPIDFEGIQIGIYHTAVHTFSSCWIQQTTQNIIRHGLTICKLPIVQLILVIASISLVMSHYHGLCPAKLTFNIIQLSREC